MRTSVNVHLKYFILNSINNLAATTINLSDTQNTAILFIVTKGYNTGVNYERYITNKEYNTT